MAKKHVRVYIEGGAEGKTADSDFRRGWKKFLTKLHEIARTKCKNGPYRHDQAHEIIAIVRPERVRTLRHGLRLFEELGNLIRNQSET